VNLSTPKVESCELCRYAQNYRGDIVFYDKFMQLCSMKKVSPSRAATEAGISKSLVTKWKTNRTQVPSPDILQKLSAYFFVPVSVLLSEEIPEEKENAPSELQLTEGEKALIKLLRRVPAAEQPVVIEKILSALDNQE
jgi:transcriptional regulator with XRE-family HTH domain